VSDVAPHGPVHRRHPHRPHLLAVVKKSSTNIVYPTLTRSNYTEWSLVMKVNLQAAGPWMVIEFGAGDYREDRSVLAAILRAVPQVMQAGLLVKSTAHDAWEAIQQVHLGADRVKEANTERIRREFNDLVFKPDETVEDFTLRLTTVASQLRVLGDVVSDKEVIKKLLHIVPDNLEQVAISMEMLLDLDSLSIEEVVGHLRAVEQRKKPLPTKESGSRLLITEEWMARIKTRDGSGSGSNTGARSTGGNNSGSKSRGNKQGTGEVKKSSTGHDDVYGYCSKKGHWARECRKKKRDEEAHVHVAHGEEDKQSLLMVHTFVPNTKSSPPAPPCRQVEIVEEKVFANLGPQEEHDDNRWILDMGATNHMISVKHFFTELDT
jgi:hypothetical protein